MSDRHEHQLARWAKKGKPGSEPVQAATVVLLRDGDEGLETLMLKRNSKIAFGGMWVFPGGRVDDGDADPQAPSDELGTARRAAVREAAEEAGPRVAAGEPGALLALDATCDHASPVPHLVFSRPVPEC